MGYCYIASRLLVKAITVASTHCAYPQRDAQAELAHGWLIKEQYVVYLHYM